MLSECGGEVEEGEECWVGDAHSEVVAAHPGMLLECGVVALRSSGGLIGIGLYSGGVLS